MQQCEADIYVRDSTLCNRDQIVQTLGLSFNLVLRFGVSPLFNISQRCTTELLLQVERPLLMPDVYSEALQ